MHRDLFMRLSTFTLLSSAALIATGCASNARSPNQAPKRATPQVAKPFPGDYSAALDVQGVWKMTYSQPTSPGKRGVIANAYYEIGDTASVGEGATAMFEVSDRAIFVEGDFSAYAFSRKGEDTKAWPVLWPIILMGPVRTGAEGTKFALTPGIKDTDRYYLFLFHAGAKGVIATVHPAPDPPPDTNIKLTDATLPPKSYGVAFMENKAWKLKQKDYDPKDPDVVAAYERAKKLYDIANTPPPPADKSH